MTYFWLAIFAASLFIEGLTVSLISIWFAVGAAIALVLAFFKASLLVQIATFFIVSIVFLFMFFCFFKKRLKTKIERTNADALLNTFGVVEEDIKKEEKGRVLVSAMSWQAKEENGKALKKGDRVEILSIKGVTLIVKKEEENKNE